MKEPFARKFRKSWRKWLRAIHRDVGYLAVGLTFIYALSGIAINHIDDWDPNFVDKSESIHYAGMPKDPAAAERFVIEKVSAGKPSSVLRAGPQIEMAYGSGRRVVIDVETGHVLNEYQSDRFFLRIANWLHYNRGKAAWTLIADIYAVLLLYLALSGMFMLRGKKGLIGRGGVFLMLGIAVPVLYVTLSGGPSPPDKAQTKDSNPAAQTSP